MIGQRKKIWFSLIAITVLLASALLAFAGKSLGAFAQTPSTPTLSDLAVPAGGWGFPAPWGTAFDSSGRVWVAVPGCDPGPKCSSTFPGRLSVYDPKSGTWPLTYRLPAGFAQPLFLAFDKQGRLWFPMPMNNSLGMLDPSTNTFNQWAVPTAGVGPWAVAIDSLGKVWFTEHYANQIGYFDPTTQQFTEVATPQLNTQPYGITVDASNNVWFTENNSAIAQIGEYTAQGNLLEYKIRSSGSTNGLTPHLITTDGLGNVWWSEGWVGAVGKLNIASAVPGTNTGVTEYPYQPPCGNCGTHTSGVAIDHTGSVWFTDSIQSILGAFDPSSSSFSVYNTPSTNSHPHDGLNIDASNNVWFTEEFAGKLASSSSFNASSSTPTATATSTPSPTATSTPSPTATTAPSPTVTVTPSPSPTPGTTLGQDNFQRPNQNFWGTASDGQKWFGDANTATPFSISGNAGLVANSGVSYSAVLGKSAANAEVVMTGSITSFNNNNFGAVLRWTDSNNWYKAYVSGSALIIQKKVKGTTTTLAQVPFTATVVTNYTIHFRVVGTTLSVNVWDSTKSEPSGWMATATDSSLTSGYTGMRMQSLGGATFTATSFQAVSLP